MHLLFLSLSFFLTIVQHAYGIPANITLSITDPALIFLSNWRVDQSVTTGSSFAFTDALGMVLKVSFPARTTAFNYFGFKRSSGSVYGFCVDCDGGSANLNVVDGFDPSLTDDSAALRTVIFSMDLDPTSSHDITIFNLPDVRFAEASELTLDSIVVTVDNAGAPKNNPINSPPIILPLPSAPPTAAPPASTNSTNPPIPPLPPASSASSPASAPPNNTPPPTAAPTPVPPSQSQSGIAHGPISPAPSNQPLPSGITQGPISPGQPSPSDGGGQGPVPTSQPSPSTGNPSPAPTGQPLPSNGSQGSAPTNQPSQSNGGQESTPTDQPSPSSGGQDPVPTDQPSQSNGGQGPAPTNEPSPSNGSQGPVPTGLPSQSNGGQGPTPTNQPSGSNGGQGPVPTDQPSHSGGHQGPSPTSPSGGLPSSPSGIGSPGNPTGGPTASTSGGSSPSSSAAGANSDKGISKSSVAIIATLALLAVLSLVLGLILWTRTRRRKFFIRPQERYDEISERTVGSQRTSVYGGLSPYGGASDTGVLPPPRPVNPYRDSIPPNVALEKPAHDLPSGSVSDGPSVSSANLASTPWVARRVNSGIV